MGRKGTRLARLVHCLALTGLLTGATAAYADTAKGSFTVGCTVTASKRQIQQAIKSPIIVMNTASKTVIY